MRVSKTSDVLLLLALTSALAPLTHLARVPTTANQVLLHQSASRKAVLSESVSVRASGRGNPLINLTDGRDVLTSYEGPEDLARAIEENSAQPLSLAADDFDEDGVPDLISGYAGPRSGIVTMLRGNVDSLFPNAPEAQRRKAEGEFTESPFLSPARVVWLPEFPDFIGTGDFDADGHRDVVAAARGSNVLYKLSGDGQGGFAPPVAINLPGAVTTLTTGEINRADGLEDVIAGITGADGAKVLVFESSDGALRSAPETFALPGEAVSLALGQLTGDYWMDLAVAAGNDLLIITGRDRKLSLDQPSKAGVPQAKINRRSFSSALKSVTTGDFTGDFKTDLALLFEDGTVEVLSPAKQRTQNVKNWRIDRTASSSWPNAKELVRAKVSTLPHDDLVIVDSAGRQLQILAGARQVDSRSRGLIATASLEAASVPVAMLPMRLNSDALSDLVILEAGHIAPVSSFTIASATVTVDSTTDVNDGDTSSIANLMSSKGVDGVISLREAITAANNTPGADTINFGIGSGVRTISIGFGFPAISDPVTIDGTTQPGFAGEPIIELDGSGSGTGADGLDLGAGAGSSTVRGLIINRFFGDGVRITTDSIHVEGCFIGTDAAGTSANGNLSNGVLIDNVPNTTIGGTVAAARNVISGNSLNGVGMQGIDGFGNAVRGNFIGTDKNGTAALGNSGSGVCISISTSNNTVGGTTASERNVISGNGGDGIKVEDSPSNLVGGNFIGTVASGSSALGNGGEGVLIDNSAGNTIGGTSPGAANVISGNTIGVEIFAASSMNNFVQGNFIGTNSAGNAAVGNTASGILLSSNSNTIGGTPAGARNIISGNNLDGIALVSASSDQVEGNFIGTDVSGTAGLGNGQSGVLINDSSNCTIGGTGAGARNVISGNNGAGIRFGGSSPMHNDVAGNFIGTAVNGVDPLGNLLAGVAIDSSFATTIGGTSPGAGNIIAFNAARGVLVNSGNASILSNSIFSNVNIGIDLGGDGVTSNDGNDGDSGPNNLQNFPVLSSVSSFGGNTAITGTLNSTASANFRVEFFSNAGCDASGNGEGQTFIGFTNVMTDGSGNAPINAVLPVSLTPGSVVTATATDSTNNTSEFSACRAVQVLSTSTFVVDSNGDLPDSNLGDMVCDDGTGHCTLRAAIEQANSNPGAQTINFNVPGLNVITISPASALPQITESLTINGYSQPGASVNTLAKGNDAVLLIELEGSGAGAGANGLDITSGSSTIEGLVINRFPVYGVRILGGSGHQITGCFIGTNPAGSGGLPNTAGGLFIQGPSTTVGGTSAGARNVISGNAGVGVALSSSSNQVLNNYIGTNASGTGALGNSFNGVQISVGQSNFVGGTSAQARNIISGNSFSGVLINGSATINNVLGNYIGTDVNGTADLGNSGDGVTIVSADNLIGSSLAGGGNVISGNNSFGVSIIGASASANNVAGNLIGTNAIGDAAIPNSSSGVIVFNASNNDIGGTTTADRNVISGNGGAGVEIRTPGSTLNRIQGNFIGTNAAGAGPLGNASSGVIVDAPNNLVGATSGGEQANVIAFNGANGVAIISGGGNQVLANSIHNNTNLGIELGSDGVTPNDSGDPDSGANGLQNFPVLASAVSGGGSVTITGSLNSNSGSPFEIQFFSNAACDASGNGEGETFIGSSIVMTDGSGNAAINVTLPVALLAGQIVTSTATNSSTNETSEFSACIAGAPPLCPISCPANISLSSDPGQCSTIVTYQVPATSAACGPVSCSPPPGAFFLTGITTVTCSAKDGAGCSFTVTVNDNQAPAITCPSNVTAALGPDESAVRVNYPAPTVTDNCSASAVCSPPSGSFFAAGVTTVTCTATDAPGNTKDCSFTVTAASSVVSINDVSIVEGNSGTTDAVFTITLSKAAALPVTINFATSDGSAKAGSDYFSTSGALTFDPGQLSKPISVRVIGDTSREPDETFFLNLSSSTNAAISDGQGICTILNDDGAPALAISDASVIEGNSGTLNAVFTVTLSPASGQTVTVTFATADDTATAANNDYVPTSGTLTFNPTERSKSIEVRVIGDNSQEPDETFLVRLSSPVNAEILDGIGAGTIINDETPLAADLSVTTSVANVINSGEQLAYTITIGNAGPRVATSIRLLDDVPTGCTLSSVRVRAGVVTAPSPGAAGRIIWALDSLAPAGEATLDLVINVLALAGDTLVNTASVQSLSPDPDLANNTSVALTTVQGGGSVELIWEQPDSTPVNPTPPPANVRVEGSGPAVSRVTKTSVAPAANKCDLVEFKVYISPTRPVQVTPSNLWKSSVPPDARKITLPALPAGTFYIVVAVWRCDGTDVDSPPSNEASAPPVPAVTKMVVKSQIKITGINFKSGLVISIDGVRFEERAVIKRGGTLVIQRGKLTDGRSIQDVLNSGKTVLMVLRNPDGGMATILLPTLASSP